MFSNLAFEIKIDRPSLIFKPGEFVTGVLNLKGLQQSIPLASVTLTAEGRLRFNRGHRKNHNAESLEQMLRDPHVIMKDKIHLTEGKKKLTTDENSWPFKFKIKAEPNYKLVESYTGVYISVVYDITAELKTPTQGVLRHSQNFYVQVADDTEATKQVKKDYPRPLTFTMVPENLLKGNTVSNRKVPHFKISGNLKSDIININDEIEGAFAIEECDHDIKSIELQLVRVEVVEYKETRLIEATEVQNVQIADGNVIKYLELLIHMVLPRFYSCPSFSYKEFTVNFEMNLIFIFTNGFKVTHNFPLYLFR